MTLKGCNRCGECCKYLALKESPKELKRYYEEWLAMESGSRDIWLIFPMLVYKGYDRSTKTFRYRCKHLTFDEEGRASCSIYDHRPYMCKDYGDFILRGWATLKYLEGNLKWYPECNLTKKCIKKLKGDM